MFIKVLYLCLSAYLIYSFVTFYLNDNSANLFFCGLFVGSNKLFMPRLLTGPDIQLHHFFKCLFISLLKKSYLKGPPPL